MSATVLLSLSHLALAIACLFFCLAGWAGYREYRFRKTAVIKNATVRNYPYVRLVDDTRVIDCKLEKPRRLKYEPDDVVTVAVINTLFGYRVRVQDDCFWYQHLGTAEISEHIMYAFIFVLISMLCFTVSFLLCILGDTGLAAEVFREMMEYEVFTTLFTKEVTG